MIWLVPAVLVGLLIAPRATAAIVVAGIVMFAFVWIYDPQCHNWAKDHPEWHGKCGIQFAGW